MILLKYFHLLTDPNIVRFAWLLFLSLSHSLPSSCFVCGEYMFWTRIFGHLLCSQPPSRPYKMKMTGLLPEHLQYGLVCCCAPSLRKIATIVVSETNLFHVMPLQNDRSLFNPLQNGLLFFLAPDCAGSILASIHVFFFCSPIIYAPTK